MLDLPRALAATIPDDPEWIDIRGMLLSPYASIIGGHSVESGFVVRVLHGAVSSVGVVGSPDGSAIREAVADVTAMTPVVCQTESAPHVRRVLAGWSEEPAIVHTISGAELNGKTPVRARATGDQEADAARSVTRSASEGPPTRLLTPDESVRLAHLPPGLHHEMTAALALGPVAATFVDDRPVAFCYPVWQTESWWDVSIDTLEPYRRRGFAIAAVRLMTDEMRATKREPVWSALASNTPSLRLAAKLGFAPVGGITVFSRDGRWTLLSGGFKDSQTATPGASSR